MPNRATNKARIGRKEAATIRPIPPKAQAEVPLDDEARNGTEPWREVDGVGFCHWDRWLLRLALDEPDGLRSIVAEFQPRAKAWPDRRYR